MRTSERHLWFAICIPICRMSVGCSMWNRVNNMRTERWLHSPRKLCFRSIRWSVGFGRWFCDSVQRLDVRPTNDPSPCRRHFGCPCCRQARKWPKELEGQRWSEDKERKGSRGTLKMQKLMEVQCKLIAEAYVTREWPRNSRRRRWRRPKLLRRWWLLGRIQDGHHLQTHAWHLRPFSVQCHRELPGRCHRSGSKLTCELTFNENSQKIESELKAKRGFWEYFTDDFYVHIKNRIVTFKIEFST